MRFTGLWVASDAKLTAKLEGELAALAKDVGYTEPKPAGPPKKPADPPAARRAGPGI